MNVAGRIAHFASVSRASSWAWDPWCWCSWACDADSEYHDKDAVNNDICTKKNFIDAPKQYTGI